MVMPAVAGLTRVCAYDRPGTILDASHLSRGRPVALRPDVPARFSPVVFEQAWRLGQKALAALLPDARHTMATESDHYIQVDQPDLVIDAVRDVVEAVREPVSWRQGRKQ